MNIVIAGGAGFVGKSLLTTWVKKNPKYSFLIIDTAVDESTNDVFSSRRVMVETQDIRSKRIIQERITEFKPDIIINAVDASRDQDFLETHLAAAENLLEVAKATGVQQYIHLSCGEVYGSFDPSEIDTHAHRLLNEYDAMLPGSPQQASKAAADLLTWSYYQRYSLPVTILRSAYLFGPYQTPQRLVPLMITHAIKNQTFPVPGSSSDLRDLLHVDDFVSAIETVMDNNEAIGQIYNVSAGVRIRITEIAEIILALLDRSKNLMQLDDEVYKRMFIGLDATKIKNELGWKARKSQDIHTMLEQTVQWYKDNRDWWEREEK